VQSVSADLIPPVRLGRLLRQRREELGWSLAELADIHGLDNADLDAIEAGVRLLDESSVALVEEVYGVEHGSIVPKRAELVIDVDEGTIAAAEHEVGVDDVSHHEQVLTRYLALVYALRGLPVGSAITFRDIDLAVLGQALAEGTDGIEHRLRSLLSEQHPELRSTSRLFRRAAVVPVAGLLVGLTAVGGLVLVHRNAGSLSEAFPVPEDHVGLTLPIVDRGSDGPGVIAHSSPSVPGVLGKSDGVDIGEAVVFERPSPEQVDADGVDIGSATRIERPDSSS